MSQTIVRLKLDPPMSRGMRDGMFKIGDFAVSAQAREPVVEASWEIIEIAKALMGNAEYAAKFQINHFYRSAKIKTKFGMVPHAISVIENTDPRAAAWEFGSGKQAVGTSAGQPRPQGGWNKPMRPLGRAAKKVGDYNP